MYVFVYNGQTDTHTHAKKRHLEDMNRTVWFVNLDLAGSSTMSEISHSLRWAWNRRWRYSSYGHNDPLLEILKHTGTCNNMVVLWFMVFNATFNNMSVISWLSVLLVEETGVTWENQRPVTSHWQTLSHNVVSSTPRHEHGLNSQL